MSKKYLDRRQFLLLTSAFFGTGIQDIRKILIQNKELFAISDSGYGSGTYGDGPYGRSEMSSSLTGVAAEYDSNDDGTISFRELSNATRDYSQGEISFQELAEVAKAGSD